MSHDLETNGNDASFVSAREDAWHRLGTVLEDTFTAEDAMLFANLGGWNVRKEPMHIGSGLVVPNKYAVVRNDPFHPGSVNILGTVGDSYTIIQNEEHAEFLNALVDESGAHFETAGSMDDGKRVFITMKLPGHLRVGGKDQVDNYLAAVNSHDGTSSFMVMVTPVRVVCKNTLNMALKSTTNKFRIRHTSGAKNAIQEAREKLDLTFAYLEEFQTTAEQLINTSMTQSRFEEIIRTEFGAAEDAAENTKTRTDKKLAEMEWLFAEACTQADICGTAWAGFNALTEWFDHYAPTRGDDDVRATRQAVNAVNDYTNFKGKALALMQKG